MRFARDETRSGVSFWLPATLANGALVIALFGLAVLVDGEQSVQARFHTSFLGLSAVVAVVSLSIGLLGGLMNPYVGDRWQAALAGIIAVFPGALMIAVLSSAATRGLMFSLVGAVLAATLVGGLYGAVAYRR